MYDQTSASVPHAPTGAIYCLRTGIAGALLATTLFFSGTFISAAIAADPVPLAGTVIVSEKTAQPTEPPSHPCSLAVIMNRNTNYNFKKGFCPNDEHYFWGVANMPSGTLITFFDSPECNGSDLDQRFWFTIRIIAKNTSTGTTYNNQPYPEKESISGMKKYAGVSPHPVIQPGIRYEAGYWKEGADYDGYLSCVRIERVKN